MCVCVQCVACGCGGAFQIIGGMLSPTKQCVFILACQPLTANVLSVQPIHAHCHLPINVQCTSRLPAALCSLLSVFTRCTFGIIIFFFRSLMPFFFYCISCRIVSILHMAGCVSGHTSIKYRVLHLLSKCVVYAMRCQYLYHHRPHSRWIDGRIDAWIYKQRASCEIQLSHMYYTTVYAAFSRRCKLKQMLEHVRQRQTERE